MGFALTEGMEPTPVQATPTAKKPKRASRAAGSEARRSPASATARSRTPASGAEEPRAFVTAEVHRELQDRVDREVRALLRDYPYAVLGGVFGAGLLLAGGWSGRLGRLAVFAAERYFASMATETFGER